MKKPTLITPAEAFAAARLAAEKAARVAASRLADENIEGAETALLAALTALKAAIFADDGDLQGYETFRDLYAQILDDGATFEPEAAPAPAREVN